MDFEMRDDVIILVYLKMIEYKIVVLIEGSLSLGVIFVEVGFDNCYYLVLFGCNIGLVF